MKSNFLIFIFPLFLIGLSNDVFGQSEGGTILKNDSITKRYSIGIELQNKAVYSMKFIISEIRTHVSDGLTNITVKDKIVQFTTSAILQQEEVSQWINPYDATITSFNIIDVQGSEIMNDVRK